MESAIRKVFRSVVHAALAADVETTTLRQDFKEGKSSSRHSQT
jgi:hypothetical protein